MANYIETASKIRRKIIEVGAGASTASHFGGSLSSADILATLYGGVLKFDVKNPEWEDRDRFILSKGHSSLVFYCALNVAGFISDEELVKNYLQDGGYLLAHPHKNIKKGIECSTGSLGQGLSFGIGQAIALKRAGKTSRVYVLLGDGECDEGSCWEAFMSAPQYNLDNIVAIVDCNGFQSDGSTEEIMNVDIAGGLKAMGWHVLVVNGNDTNALNAAFEEAKTIKNQPTAIIAKTIKGKGVSFMENTHIWHHGKMNKKQVQQALTDINDGNK
jgi:transketolase